MDFYSRFVFPLLKHLPPEKAHGLALRILPFWPASSFVPDPILQQRIWNLSFLHPLGLAAGFDKDGQALSALSKWGFSFLEAGTVTPKPQEGNTKPRLFRSEANQAIINRMGFNNRGIDALSQRLRHRGPFLLGINLGKNRESADAIADFTAGIKELAPYADYFTINISSPNTPGLRDWQSKEKLRSLLERLQPFRGAKPLLVKIAPDLEDEQLAAIADLALEKLCSGLIVGNTTLSRPPGLDSAFAAQSGGLSGRPLFSQSTQILRKLYRLTEGNVPLIGVGGIENAETAYAKIRAGASLLQLYSALIFQGPGLVGRIVGGLSLLLKRDGYTHIHQAVGADINTHEGGSR